MTKGKYVEIEVLMNAIDRVSDQADLAATESPPGSMAQIANDCVKGAMSALFVALHEGFVANGDVEPKKKKIR